ncbi:hypothetical protein PZB75_09480 [Streptomyces sp. AM 4-1-1]|uniref:hypothetical protein n=1 Tax=Streptomyces sp. AM 4-1-1 TaxID=3028710 RepID=UPI0023B89E98|nr:hypothetical protein [Streptomyces sp. AM 4-1-1]WEH33585.1 hypothetical protein PZB75_09480 [Streptomyces sp. AM 4-1-1]
MPDIVAQYDSNEDPHLRSEFLEAVGMTRTQVEYLRLRRDAEERASKSPMTSDDAPPRSPGEAPGPRGRGPRRAPRRSRVADSRPPNRDAMNRRRARGTTWSIVIVIELD